MNLFKRFTSIFSGSETHDYADSLDGVRRQGLELFAGTFVILMFSVGSMRLATGFHLAAAIEYSAALLSCIVLFLSHKRFIQLSSWLGCGLALTLTAVLAYDQAISLTNLFIGLVFIDAIFIILFQKTRDAVFVVFLTLILAYWISDRYEQPITETIPALFLLITLSAAFLYTVKFIERQDARLKENVVKLNSLNLIQEELNDELKAKNNDLKTFTHIMSHDLKSPLITITSFSELVSERIKGDDSKTKEYLGYISSSAESMSHLIQDLLTYSRVESSELVNFQEVNLNELIGEITAMYQFEIVQNKLVFKIDELPTILGNADLLHTLFYNLISNSVKYQPKDNDTHIPRVTIKADKSDPLTTLIISDNGIGIKPEYVQNLFTPFKRFHNSSDYEGTGLGMSIVKKVMNKHNGTIEVLNTSDKGTSFRLVFPDNNIVDNS